MIRIDDTLLEEIGLISLPKTERDQLLRQIYETLEMRVGMRLAERMTDQQLDEFERFIDTNDEAGALKWLESNFPDYKQVVADELEKLKGEIKKDAPQIIASMQQGGGSQPSMQSPAVSQQQPPAFGTPSDFPSQSQPPQVTSAMGPQPLPQQPLPQQPSPPPFQANPQFAAQPDSSSTQSNFGTPAPDPMPSITSSSPQQSQGQDDNVAPQSPVSPPQDDGIIPPPPSF